MNKLSGFSLLEILIAITMGTMVLLGIVTLFNVEQQQYRYSLSLSYFNTLGITLSHFFEDEIKTAGYVGCAKLTDNLVIHNTLREEEISLFPENALVGYSSEEVTTDLIGSHPPFVNHSDVLVLRKMAIQHNYLLADMTDSSEVTINISPKYKTNDIIILSDCRSVTIGKVKTVSISRANNTQTLELTHNIPLYKAGAELGLFQQFTFYVATTARKTPRGDPVNALYMNDIYGKSYELAEGVDNLILTYFLPQGSNLEEVSHGAVTHWSLLKSVHASLLMESPYYVDNKTHSYYYKDETQSASPGILKHSWEIYAAKKN